MKTCIHPLVGTAGGVTVCGIFSWHTVDLLAPAEHHLNSTVYLSIVAHHVRPFMTTLYPFSDCCFQQDKGLCHKTQISDWFLEPDK